MVRDGGLDGKDIPKLISLSHRKRLGNQNLTNFVFNHLHRHCFKLPKSLKRMLLKNDGLGKERFQRKKNTMLVFGKQ